jgi:hypothetical protein
MEGKHLAIEIGSLCKVAVVIDLTYYTKIRLLRPKPLKPLQL